jgi:hypothetical protein
MGFLRRLIGGNHPTEAGKVPLVEFGRFSDSYKDEVQYQAWDEALERFEKQDYLDSFKAFFKYLRDDKEDNIAWHETNGGLEFEIYQGSKLVNGSANALKFKAQARVVKANALNIGFMRRLIEQNFDLKYCRFSLAPNNEIVILFDAQTLDSSPYKLYYALKELALNADKQDDLLMDEFEMLEQVESSPVEQIDAEEKSIKYNFVTEKIRSVVAEVENGRLRADQYPGAIAYLLLDLTYRLDYLISPEGYMMEVLERIHRQYFENDGKTVAQKNTVMLREFEKLLQRPKEIFSNELYRVRNTFGITTPVNHDRIVSFVEGELHNIDWYKDNNHTQVALSIPGYIVGYCLFNYAAPKPMKEMLELYFKIMEPAYFKSLGFTEEFLAPASGEFNKKAIRLALEKIAEKHRAAFPKFKPGFQLLNFSTLPEFAKSYLIMVSAADLTKAD